jgi:predicted porin
MYGVGYVHFFTPLETDSSPYAMREFLQHPSTIEASLALFSFERTWTGTTAKAEGDGSELEVGGMYFVENMGFGAELTMGKMDMEVAAFGMKEEEETTGITLKGAYYINETTRLDLMLEMEDEETDDLNSTADEEAEATTFILGASTLIDDKIYLEGALGMGTREVTPTGGTSQDYDTLALELMFGYYFNQQLGLMVGYETMGYENSKSGVTDEGSEDTWSLGVEYYPNESAYAGVFLVSMKGSEESGGTIEDSDGMGLRLYGGFLF